MDEETASNVKLGLEVQGTTDEVDSSEIHPAPAPTAEELQHTSVDVSSSQAIGNHEEPGIEPAEAVDDDRIEGLPLQQDAADPVPLPIPEDEGDVSLGYTDDLGSQSPATRTLELPPALDLSQSQDPIHGTFTGEPAEILEDVPLASPTTDAVVEEAERKAQFGAEAASAQNSASMSSNAVPPAQGQNQQPQEGPATNKWGAPPPPPKPPVFTYVHDDSDTAMSELEEFFSYVEVRGVVEEGREAWSRGWEAASDTNWVEASITNKKAHIYHLIEELEHRDPEIRFEASRRLAYIAQGTPIYSTSPEHHLQLVVSNCSLLRSAGALTAVHEALKSASGRWNIISSMPEADPSAYGQPQTYFPSLTPQERQEYLEEINGELAVHLSILYFMLEILRGDPTWADELMSLDPPLPIYLFSLVAGLREKNAKGYPVKKLLLLLWKSLLACLGGNKDIKRVKRLVRKIEGLPKDIVDDSHVSMKTGPLDFATFKGEILSKYPTYEPPNIVAPIPQIPLDRIVAAAASAPLRQSYQLRTAVHGANGQDGAASGSGLPPAPMTATPAPSPPPSPPPMKPKKQQYQTDQTKPFVLPFSRANVGGGHYSIIKGKGKMTVPYSIDEAGKLYQKNFRISTELWQTWKLREEYLADETGFGSNHSKQQVEDDIQSQRINALARHFEATSLEENGNSSKSKLVSENDLQDKPAAPDSLSMLYQLENTFRGNLKAHKKSIPPAEQGGEFNKRSRKLMQRVEDVKRLQRIELIYRSTLNHMHSAVIVLLKLLLATVTANTNATTNAHEDEAAPYLNLEETDIMRHREITSKAVSAILILTLRWFKTSHAMKFHYLAHLLVDSNCLLLILKMFGLQEVMQQVQTKNEVPEWNFFQFCHLYGSAIPAPSQPDGQSTRIAPRPAPFKQNMLNSDSDLKSGDEPEIITSFSYRNFFAVINFVHVLQKLTKRKPHRILLLVQYKSSAILKRILKVSHPLLQLYVLKVIKSQIPYSGRKWRQSNMKVITAIYLNCRPDLRDEWLTTIDIDNDLDESMPHEQTLRTLVHFFNSKHYGSFAPHLHRRTSSHSGGAGPAHFDGQGAGAAHLSGQEQAFGSSQGTQGVPPPSPLSAFAPHTYHYSSFFDNESFPPARPLSMFSGEDHYRTSYIPDSLMDGYLEDYEELLGDLFTPSYDSNGMPVNAGTPPFTGSTLSGGMSPSRALGDPAVMGPAYLTNAEQAWHRLGEILGEADSISDSESVTSIGYLDIASDGEASDLSLDEGPQPGTNDWEHLSPDLATALEDERERQEYEERLERASPGRRKRTSSPHSPRLRRSSSGTPRSPALRPVLIDMDSQDDNEDYDDSAVEEEEDEPLPRIRSPRRSPHLSPSKVAIDEVEAFWPDEDPM